MPNQSADIGDSRTLTATFLNDAGVDTDPTAVTLIVTTPAGVATTYSLAAATITHVSTGNFSKSIALTQAGVWQWVWTGTGAVQQTEAGFLVVGSKAHDSVCSSWASLADLNACHTSEANDLLKAEALGASSDVLWRLSGYRYPGLCSDTVRPCAQNSWIQGNGYNDQYGWGYGGWWSWIPAWGFCACNSNSHRACGCTYLSEIRLGRAPIQGILSVKEDGLTLVNGVDYRVDDNEWLVRLGGNSWHCCQDLSLDDTHDNTWSVSFVYGQDPPASGVQACIDLAWEYVKTCADGDCAPPERTYNMQRQGTTVQMISPERFGLDSYGNLRMGIKSVDRFLLAVGNTRPALIASPDIDSDVRRVAT